MTTRNVTFEKLAAQRIIVCDAHVVYEPSVYGGDGSEPRKNIVLSISPAEEALIQELETEIDPKKLNSAVKDGTVKCKMTMETVHVFDSAKTLMEHPPKWRGCLVNAVILMRGKWSSKTQSGLSLEVVGFRYSTQLSWPNVPFSAFG